MENIKNLACEKLADFFIKTSDRDNIISDVFDFLGFDCTVRCYVKSDELDALIRNFYQSYDVAGLCSVIELIQKGKNAACMNEKSLLEDIKTYISEHLTDDTALEQVAAELHVSYYYLCHFFKQQTGQSLNRYRVTKRLERAIRLLLSTDKKISDIALLCGFNNISYFSETFVKYQGETPSDFRQKHGDCFLHDFYSLEDMLLSAKMEHIRFLDSSGCVTQSADMTVSHVHDPCEEYGYFLHEAAIIEYEGVLYASWYTCKEKELIGYTPIIGRRSYDGGKTWTSPEVIAEDKSGKIIYCPPVYGICGGKLYMLINQMVAPDHIHSLDLLVLNKDTDKFELVWSRPIPFKLNTNVNRLPNGKLLLPGRIAELDGFPITPAVMISDSGKIDSEWRVVHAAENGLLPDGESLGHSETTVICCDDILYLFNRNDRRRVPLVYISKDFGETWSKAIAHDIPFINSKIYSGCLSDGRFYLIANTDKANRSKLVLFVSEKGSLNFRKQIILFDRSDSNTDITSCHYPCAIESNGKLYIIATANYDGSALKGRGAILFTVDLKSI